MAGELSPAITANVDATLAQIDNLGASRAHREQSGLFFVEGVRNVLHASDHGWTIEQLVLSKQLLTAAVARARVRALREHGTHVVRVTPEQFRRVSRAEHASGIGAIVRQRWSTLHACAPNACWVVLEHVRSPGNLGTLIRSSNAFGGAGFVLLGTGVDPFDPSAVRASMGSVFQQSFVRTSTVALQHWVARRKPMVVGAAPDGALDFRRVRYQRPTLLMLGDERKGLSAAQRALCSHCVRIPMAQGVDSLNLAVAGSLLLFAAQQRA